MPHSNPVYQTPSVYMIYLLKWIMTMMTPGEFKNGGQSLNINYSFADKPFGQVIVALTAKGICKMAFADDGQIQTIKNLKVNFSIATYRQLVDGIQQNALFSFKQD